MCASIIKLSSAAFCLASPVLLFFITVLICFLCILTISNHIRVVLHIAVISNDFKSETLRAIKLFVCLFVQL